MASQLHADFRASLTSLDLSLETLGRAIQQQGSCFPGDVRKTAQAIDRLRSCLTEFSRSDGNGSVLATALPVYSSSQSAHSPSAPGPDGETLTPAASPTLSMREEKYPPLRWSCPWLGFKIRNIWIWCRTPSGWTLGLTFASVAFALTFGVFSIMAWDVAVKANQKADVAILIAKYQYKLDEYTANLTMFATELAIQTRNDGRLSNMLQYYAICMSNLASFPGLCERLVPGSIGSNETFARNFNNTFPDGIGSGIPLGDSLSNIPGSSIDAPPSSLFDDLTKGKARSILANHMHDMLPAFATIPVILPLAALLTFLVV